MTPEPSLSSPRQKAEALVYLLAFIACIPAANWMIGNLGTVCAPPHGPCLVPVWPWGPKGMDIVGIDLQQLASHEVGLGRLLRRHPGGHRVLQRFGAQDAVGIPGGEDLHRRGALGRIRRLERGLEVVVLGGIGEACASLPLTLGSRVQRLDGKRQRQCKNNPPQHRHCSSFLRRGPERP